LVNGHAPTAPHEDHDDTMITMKDLEVAIVSIVITSCRLTNASERWA
jgi:hypothetical protein